MNGFNYLKFFHQLSLNPHNHHHCQCQKHHAKMAYKRWIQSSSFFLRWSGKSLKLNSHTVVRFRVWTQVMTYDLAISTFANWAMTSRHVNTILICEKRKEKEKIYKYMQNVDKIKRLKFIKKKSAVLVHATFRINKKQNTLVFFYFFLTKVRPSFLYRIFLLLQTVFPILFHFLEGTNIILHRICTLLRVFSPHIQTTWA